MTFDEFLDSADFFRETKLEQAILLAYYHLKTTGESEIYIREMSDWFTSRHLAAPNVTRLRKEIEGSRDFINDPNGDAYRLHRNTIRSLDDEFDGLTEPTEEVESHDTILPSSLYSDTRGYIKRLAKQVNASYEKNIFDGCAVLMRRLVEILIILAYKNLGIEDEIKGGDRHAGMKTLIEKAKRNDTLDLSKDAKDCVDEFRTLGNFSAHKIHYNCRRTYIEENISDFRVLVEELLHKSDLI